MGARKAGSAGGGTCCPDGLDMHVLPSRGWIAGVVLQMWLRRQLSEAPCDVHHEVSTCMGPGGPLLSTAGLDRHPVIGPPLSPCSARQS